MSFTANRGAAAYRTTQVESRSPLELVVMLYDGLVRSLGEARDAMARNDLRSKRKAVSMAIGILDELQNTLDREKGGEMAVRLEALYVYTSSRVLDSNIKGEAHGFDEALKLMAPLRDAWAAISAQGTGAKQVSA